MLKLMEHKDYTEIHPGTFVTRTILNNLGSPDDALKIIHIAGTNGKGSTAEFFTQVLISAGKKAGTFTSPQVYDFYDQFRIDGKPISPEKIEGYFERALNASQGLGATDFEIQTASVILAFKEEGCEYAVLECGMGGLNDATNAVNKKELAVITSISLEHTAYLGDTLEKICEQKAGIIKGGCRVVINASQPQVVKDYFDKLGRTACRIIYTGLDSFIYDGDMVFYLKSKGMDQIHNAATVIEGAKMLGLPDRAIYDGIQNTRIAGRKEKITAGGRDYYLDGAHNPAALEELKRLFKDTPQEDITVIYGCLADKDIDGNLVCLAGMTQNIIAVECNSPRKMPLDKISRACKKYFDNASDASSVCDALDKAHTKTVIVCGSFTLLKEAKEWIEKKL